MAVYGSEGDVTGSEGDVPGSEGGVTGSEVHGTGIEAAVFWKDLRLASGRATKRGPGEAWQARFQAATARSFHGRARGFVGTGSGGFRPGNRIAGEAREWAVRWSGLLLTTSESTVGGSGVVRESTRFPELVAELARTLARRR
jgi:hypothetical protein